MRKWAKRLFFVPKDKNKSKIEFIAESYGFQSSGAHNDKVENFGAQNRKVL